jgi:hypothetical protein
MNEHNYPKVSANICVYNTNYLSIYDTCCITCVTESITLV